MRVTATSILAALFVLATPIARADWIANQTTLADVSKANTSTFVKRSCTVLGVNGAVASLSFNGLQSSFGQDFSTAHDWSAYNIVDMMVTDKSTVPLNFKFIVQLQSDSGSYTNAYVGNFYIQPGPARHILCYLNIDNPMPYGMEYLNPVLTADALEVFGGPGDRNLGTTWHWRLSSQSSTTCKIDVSNMRLLRQSLNFTGICDAFGQYTDKSWPTKVSATSQFQALLAGEKTDLSAHPGPGEMFGTSKLANPKSTIGKWTVVNYSNGSKFLQYPNGKLFWCFGMNTVSDTSPTPIQGRTAYFKSLPSTTGSYSSCYSVNGTINGNLQSYSFRKQNLMMKYGANYLTPWLSMVKSRLNSWGVNTVGIDSNSSLLNGSIPFTMSLSTDKFVTRFRAPSMKGGSLPDPFDSTFLTWCQSNFKSQLSASVANNNLMGVFVDNELDWGSMDTDMHHYNIGLGAFTAPSTQPAKIAFVNQLEAKYVTIDALNKSWGTGWPSWTSIQNGNWKPTIFTTGLATDLKLYQTLFANTYFGRVKSALTYAGLKSFYLGCRFSVYTDEAVASASTYADILTFNVYRYYFDVPWAYFGGLKKPVLFSEFGFSMRAMGTFGGPVPMASSIGRASCIQSFLNDAIVQPNIVGAIYYCYADQPITGRYSDYENAGLGIMDVTDEPYSDSVNVLRTFTQSMYTTRAGL